MNPLKIFSLLPLLIPLHVAARSQSNASPTSIPNYSSSTPPHKAKDPTTSPSVPPSTTLTHVIAPWSFYPYTTAVRQLPESERRFFGPLGYHTRDADQRKEDQTYVWFIPKKTSVSTTTTTTTATESVTVSMWREMTVGAETVTQTVVVTETAIPTSTSTIQDEHLVETVVPLRMDAAYTSTPVIAAALGAQTATSAMFYTSTSHHNAAGDPYPIPTIIVTPPHIKRTPANLTVITVNRSPDTRDLNALILTIAQMTGFIVIGLLVSFCTVVLLIWCSQPLWWPWVRKRPDREPHMPGAWVDGLDGPGEASPDSQHSAYETALGAAGTPRQTVATRRPPSSTMVFSMNGARTPLRPRAELGGLFGGTAPA